jgi:DHA1 family bicyclomycin/chloramphenicol resistance-like MFS transporter
VPILAPTIGQAVLLVAGWRWIFVGLLAMASIAAIWLALRQEETLPLDHRLPFSARSIGQGALEVVTTPITLGYTLAVGAIFGSFITYLATSQQIFSDQYGQGKLFAVWFGVLAIGIAIAMMVNAKLVMRYGMRVLSKLALRASLALAAAFLALATATGGHPPLWTLGGWLLLTFFCSGLLFGNYNAIAMEPMGRIAGIAAAVTGALSSLVALALGTAIGFLYDGTVIPLAAGFAFCNGLAFLLSEWAERSRR